MSVGVHGGGGWCLKTNLCILLLISCVLMSAVINWSTRQWLIWERDLRPHYYYCYYLFYIQPLFNYARQNKDAMNDHGLTNKLATYRQWAHLYSWKNKCMADEQLYQANNESHTHTHTHPPNNNTNTNKTKNKETRGNKETKQQTNNTHTQFFFFFLLGNRKKHPSFLTPSRTSVWSGLLTFLWRVEIVKVAMHRKQYNSNN